MVARVTAILSFCAFGGCSGCYESTSSDGGAMDASSVPDAAAREDCGEWTLDPGSLTACGDAMSLYGERSFAEDPDLLAGCERFRGGFDFAYATITDASALASLRWIDGRLSFFHASDLVSLAGLEQLEHVAELSISGLSRVEDLSPLARLRRVENRLIIDGNGALESLHGLEQLQEVGDLVLFVEPELSDSVTLGSLACLRQVRGDVDLRNVRRAEVDAFLARVEVEGTVTLDGEIVVAP